MAVGQTVTSVVTMSVVVTGTRHDISVKYVRPPYVFTHVSKNTTPSYTINSHLHLFCTCLSLSAPPVPTYITTTLSRAHHSSISTPCIFACTCTCTCSHSLILYLHFLLCILGFVHNLHQLSTCYFKSTQIFFMIAVARVCVHDIHACLCSPPTHTRSHAHTRTHTHTHTSHYIHSFEVSRVSYVTETH